MLTLTGCACPFGVAPDLESLAHHRHRPLPWAPNAFTEAIDAGQVRVLLEYRDDLLLASQQDRSLDLWQGDEGLMFRARLVDPAMKRTIARGLHTRGIRHVCITGKYDRVLVHPETGEHVARSRATDLTINLLNHQLGSRPTIPGTWVRCERA